MASSAKGIGDSKPKKSGKKSIYWEIWHVDIAHDMELAKRKNMINYFIEYQILTSNPAKHLKPLHNYEDFP